MRQIDIALNQAFKQMKLKPGDIYESCSYPPVLCLGVDYKQDEVWGVSLIDGHYPASCSLVHCGVQKLTPRQAWNLKMHGPADAEARERIPVEDRWWNAHTEQNKLVVKLVGPRKDRKVRTKHVVAQPNRNAG
jgi:hypothetical protein